MQDTLKGDSEVFVNASELAGDEDRTLHLTDPDIETAPVITRFLNLATTAKLALPRISTDETDVELCRDLIRLIRFLEKYECNPLWRRFHLCCLEHLIMKKMHPRVGFVLGCAACDYELCESALNTMCGLYCEGSLSHGCRADPANFSLDMWELLAPEHTLAYVIATQRNHALKDHSTRRLGLRPVHRIGSTFKEIMESPSRYFGRTSNKKNILSMSYLSHSST